MCEAVNEQIVQLLQLNQQLQSLAQENMWEVFIDDLESYAQQLKKLTSQFSSPLDTPLNITVLSELEKLLLQDRVLAQVTQTRMNLLSQNMSAMRKSRHSSRAYNAV